MVMYTHIDHEVRRKFGISCNDYCVAELIHLWSFNPVNLDHWCYASKETIGENLSLTKLTILNIINNLLDKGIVEKHAQTKHLRTTALWYKSAHDNRNGGYTPGIETIPTVQKVDQDSINSISETGIKNIPNNNNIDNKNNSNNIQASIPDISLQTVLNNTNTIIPGKSKAAKKQQELITQMEMETPEGKMYRDFMSWIDKWAPSVNTMKEPFTFQQYLQMLAWKKEGKDGYSDDEVRKRLAKMHNSVSATKKNKSAYYTYVNWATNNW